MMDLCYRPADDMFVIRAPDGTVVAETNATLLAARKTRDPDAAHLGVLRFLDFREWQVKACGSVLFAGSVEKAMATATRL